MALTYSLVQELDAGRIAGQPCCGECWARWPREADLLDLIKRHRLPLPMLNPRLFVGEEFLSMRMPGDRMRGVAAEVDSREWHISPADWERTMARHAGMSAHGIIVLHYQPSRIGRFGRDVAAEILATLAAASHRDRLPIPAESAVSWAAA